MQDTKQQCNEIVIKTAEDGSNYQMSNPALAHLINIMSIYSISALLIAHAMQINK